MKNKYLKLLLCLFLDALGYVSYFILGVGETTDLVWAPLAGWLNYTLFGDKAGVGAALFTFIEEALPGTDFIPSFSITWFYVYILNGNKNAQKTGSFTEVK